MKDGQVVVDGRSGGSGRSSGSGGAGRLGGLDREVQSVVEAFLLHLGDHEWDKVAADLAPNAMIVVTRQRPGETDWTNSYQTRDEWLASLRRNPNPTTFREPITNVQVTVDSDHLAYLRADFQVMRDGAAQSHGVDQFTLVREGGAWKIAIVAYTSMPLR
ncbi:MAG: hypothetical protein DMG03_18965 [Acidobacteria bacterium]|nr:MAG: hypothetical protein DMG03_18965 [Acidobacteriota bacterium]